MAAGARPNLDRWPLAVAIAVAFLALSAAALTPLPIGQAVGVAVLAAIAMHCVGHPGRLAWWWGALIPIDVVNAVHPVLLDTARYGGLLWLIVAFGAGIAPERRREVMQFAVLVGAVGLIRLTASTARMDRFGMFIAAVQVVGALTAPFLAVRIRAHAAVLAGFMAGVTLSAITSLMQAIDLTTLRLPDGGPDRYPGLASTTMLITWHLAFALIVAGYFIHGRQHPGLVRLNALIAVPLCGAALVVNGAQGGLLGLGFAALALLAFGWRDVPRRTLARAALGGLAFATILVAVVMISGIGTPTIDGIAGTGDYRNEIARVDAARWGWNEMVAHPLTGIGRTNFEDEYGLAPHFLPLEAGITSGVVGFLVAGYLLWTLLWVVLRGPVGRRPASWLGLALCAAMFANTLTEMGGPFTGLPRFALLLIAVVACRGEPWPADEVPAATPADEPLSA